MLNLEADVYVSHPGGQVQQISPGNGLFYQSCIHPMDRASSMEARRLAFLESGVPIRLDRQKDFP
ncbi:MAG: hypothetical protein GY725_04440 [bacterium]|nr:hypothetical protein [bacterium]